jgi:hypothetical protein
MSIIKRFDQTYAMRYSRGDYKNVKDLVAAAHEIVFTGLGFFRPAYLYESAGFPSGQYQSAYRIQPCAQDIECALQHQPRKSDLASHLQPTIC